MTQPQPETMPGPRPLDNLKILDFTHVLAGPFATRILGDMGADVVKIGSSTVAGIAGANATDHPYYVMWNRNKRSLALDLSQPEARAICRRLCDAADVVIDNFSVGVLDRWGVGYEEVAQTNPRVIYVQMSGMGEGGPWSKFVTYAPTVHALAGITALTGVPGRDDIGIGFSYNDHQSGLHGAVAVLAAVEARQRTGHGQRVDISQFEVGVTFAGPSLLDLFVNGHVAQPAGNRLPYDDAAPHNCYRCLDGPGVGLERERWVAIACMTDDHWHSLRRLMGDPAWAIDERYSSVTGRTANLETLDEHVTDWTRTMNAEQLMALCQANGVPAGVVQTGADLVESDPQFQRSNFLQQMDEPHPVLGETPFDRLPLYFSRTPADSYRRSRNLGEDNVEVLADWLDLPAADVRRGESEGYFV